MDYGVLLIGNTLTLLKPQDIETPREPTLGASAKVGSDDSWLNLINVYGKLENGISQIRLLQEDDITEVVGTVSYHPTDATQLIFNPDIDTLPGNTLDPFNAIIDPHKVTVDSEILSPATGTRYLILKDIGSLNNPSQSGAVAWRGTDGQDLVARANDIIEYTGEHWSVVFDARSATEIQYASNLTTGTQYKWNKDFWVKSWEGEYRNGLWTLVL
jgi:hypothetical protein